MAPGPWRRRPRPAWPACAAARGLPSRGSWGSGFSASGCGEGGRTRRVEVFPDAAGELPGIAGPDRLELGGDAIAGADLDLAGADAGLELIERAHRRAADPLA